MGRIALAAQRAQAVDARTGLRRMAAGEWAAYHYLKKAEAEAESGSRFGSEVSEAVQLAGVDLREAESFHTGIAQVWPLDVWKPIHNDTGLFHLVALVYLSELLLQSKDKFQACLKALRGSMSADQLRTLLQFGRWLSPGDLSGFCDADLAVVAIREIAPRMSRSPLEYVDEIVRSSYGVSYPRRDCGPACATALNYIRQRINAAETPELVELFTRLECGVVDCYAKESVVLSNADWEDYFEESFEAYWCDEEPAWGHLTVGEARQLLAALCDEGSLLTHLVIRRPPNSVFPSHLIALYDCTTHARLWLLSARATALLPIYGPFALAYKDVGRGWEKYLDSSRRRKLSSASDNGDTCMSASSDAHPDISCAETPSFYDDPMKQTELAVLSSPVGFMERVPSLVERLARAEALMEYHEWHIRKIKTRGTLLCMFKSPRCDRVKVPRIVTGGLSMSGQPDATFRAPDDILLEGLDRTLWYETPLKLEYWLAEDASKLEQYCSLSAFLDPERLQFG